jgi:serine/threonine-protein kinase/endoribonuclease IRE1
MGSYSTLLPKKDKDTENNSEEKDAKKEKKEKKEKKKDKKEEKGVNDVGVILSRLRATVKSDVFGEGLIFGYFLSGGVHPYGSKSHEITSNILNDKPIHLKGIYFLFFLNQKNRIKLIFILRKSSQE